MWLWTIRKEQFQEMAKGRARAFEASAVLWLRQEFPSECSRLEDSDLREAVQTALQKGQTWQFDTKAEVFLYLELMFLLGWEFDQDAAQAWVKPTLSDFQMSALTRLTCLVDEARQRMRRERRAGVPA